MTFIIKPGQLTLADLRVLMDESTQIALDDNCYAGIEAAEKTIAHVLKSDKAVYGINTGFGALASTRIPANELQILQESIVLSHAAGTGELFSDAVVRLMLVLKINSLARGYSGVRRETIDFLIRLFNEKMYPCIPSQGSVGASGDLAPLAHMCTIMLGVGEARQNGVVMTAEEALKRLQLKPLILAPKEGLALLNGTQASTALALIGLFSAENALFTGLITGAMSVDAARGSSTPFDERIQQVRGQPNQILVAAILRQLLKGSEILASHENCDKVQDPYSLRCQPQVMGACLSNILYAAETLLIEANAVSDNPLVFADDKEILSGGNFHAEPVAMAADMLAVAIAEIGSISERRIALLVDPRFSRLPAFLVDNAGINSGFMMAQVTAAALTSENKSLAHPGSVDSIPTSANQEDHVSMATFAARRLQQMANNTIGVLSIELLAACQGLDFLRPLNSSEALEKVHQKLREHVAYYAKDRYFAPDIAKATALIQSRQLLSLTGLTL